MAEREPIGHDSRSVSEVEKGRAAEEEIRGAFGTIRLEDRNPRRTWRQRLLTLAAIMGCGR
jgi:hypothetical protein